MAVAARTIKDSSYSGTPAALRGETVLTSDRLRVFAAWVAEKMGRERMEVAKDGVSVTWGMGKSPMGRGKRVDTGAWGERNG